MTLPLTEAQEKLWRYIRSCERSPSYEEMMNALGYTSKAPIHALIRQLKEKGFIEHMPRKARSIVALDPRVELTAFTTDQLSAELIRRLVGA